MRPLITKLVATSALAAATLIALPADGGKEAAVKPPPETGTLLVLNKGEATVSLIDLSSGLVAATVPTGEAPHEVAVHPGGRWAAITNYGSREAPGSTITVIDIPSARVLRTVDLDEHRRPHGIVWPAKGPALVTAEESQALLLVDLEAGQVTAAVPTGQETSHMVAMAAAGARAFVTSIGSGTVTAIDTAEARRLTTLATGAGAEGITVTPDGSQVWVTNRDADTVTVIDALSMEIIAELPAPSFPIRAQATPDGRHVLVSTARSGELAVFAVASRREIRRIAMDHQAEDTEGRLFAGRFGESSVPIGILVHPGGRVAYVANANADVISVVDLETWSTRGFLSAGREPDGLGFSPLAVEPGSRE